MIPSKYELAVGSYQTACESSPNKSMIDQWLNEGKSASAISKLLKEKTGEYISDKGIGKYKKYREELIERELRKSPDYQAQMSLMNEELAMGIGKMKHVDVMLHVADVIEQSAEMLVAAREDEVRIKNAQDYRFVTQTMLDAIKIYGDTVLKAQRMQEIQNDPTLLKPQTTININVRNVLVDALRGAQNGGDTSIIDRLRGVVHGSRVVDAKYEEVSDDRNNEEGI